MESNPRVGPERAVKYEARHDNRYQYDDFFSEEIPAGELLVRQIQAQSYLNNEFVHPTGLVTHTDDEGNVVQVLVAEISNPSAQDTSATDRAMECSIGIEKGSIDVNPLTGKLVAWRKYHAGLDELPAYNFCKDNLWTSVEEELRNIDADPIRHLVEPEGLGKTKYAGPGVVTEFMRHEIQRVVGKGEVWLMGLVEKTVYQMWVRNWGPLAVRQVGEPRKLVHPYVNPDVKLVPTLMDIDKFYDNFYQYLVALDDSNELSDEQMERFFYMTDGVSDSELGEDVALFRERLRRRYTGTV